MVGFCPSRLSRGRPGLSPSRLSFRRRRHLFRCLSFAALEGQRPIFRACDFHEPCSSLLQVGDRGVWASAQKPAEATWTCSGEEVLDMHCIRQKDCRTEASRISVPLMRSHEVLVETCIVEGIVLTFTLGDDRSRTFLEKDSKRCFYC